MLRNYFKIAIRNLFKQKGLSLINILGLSIGLACFSLFLLYAVHEFSFDRVHEHADRVYRIYRWTENINGRGTEGDPHLPMPLGPAFQADFPDVEEMVRWKDAWGENFVKVAGEVSRAEVCHVESNVFDVFTFPLKYGSKETALSDPRNVVLTEEMAIKLFKESNPTGKIIKIKIDEDFEPFTVAAVAENIPTNSSKQFQIMGSFEYFKGTNLGKRKIGKWNNSFLGTFVKLREGSRLHENPKALHSFREKYYPDTERNIREAGRWSGDGPPVTYRLQPLRDIHLNTTIYGADVPSVAPRNIMILLGIAAGILLVAIINFTTLSIGRSAGRAKEVGIRKVVGSSRRQLAGQFLMESLLMSIISILIGLGIAHFLLPFFNELSGRELSFSFSQLPETSWLILVLTMFTGLLAGSYPALILSKFKPVEVFKNKFKVGGANWFTKSLVTTQFVVSISLVIATLVILSQLNFLRSKNPGFNKENVVVVDAEETNTNEIYPRFKNEILKNPSVLGVASSELTIGAGSGWSSAGFEYNGEYKSVYEYFVDKDFLQVMGLELIAGRGFEASRQDRANRSLIINESMMNDFGWTLDNVIGQDLPGFFNEGSAPVVIGVVKDFHFRSFHENVKPQMFHQFEDYVPMKFFVRISEGDPAPVLASMEKAWNGTVDELPFKYSFLDEDVDRFYRSEARFSSIIAWAGGITIFLACLGLLGLAALASINRTKEIGIRKILGASVFGIMSLLSKDFIKQVLIALIIAAPLAWYFLQSWLENFAYRIKMPWWAFLLAGLIAVGVAVFTVGLQSLKAAVSRPSEALRSE